MSGCPLRLLPRPPLHQRLQHQRHQRQQRQQGGDGEGVGRGQVEVVVVGLDLERQRGHALDAAGDHRDGPELAHRAGVAQDDAVQQAPLDVGQGDAPERLPAARPQRQRRLLLVRPLRLHHGDQFARDEREGHERRRQHDPRHGEDDFQVVRVQPGEQPAAAPEHQHERQAGDHGRDRERQVNQRRQDVLAPEVELGDRPGGADAEERVQRHGDAGGDEGQLDGADRVGVAERPEVGRPSGGERLREDGAQRHDQKQGQERQHEQGQQDLDPGRLRHAALLGAMSESPPAAGGSAIAAR